MAHAKLYLFQEESFPDCEESREERLEIEDALGRMPLDALLVSLARNSEWGKICLLVKLKVAGFNNSALAMRLRFIRLLALLKMERFSVAESELEGLKSSLKRLSFEMELLWAILPMRSQVHVSITRLVHLLLDTKMRLWRGLSNNPLHGTVSDNPIYEGDNPIEVSSDTHLLLKRQDVVKLKLFEAFVSIENYELAEEILYSLEPSAKIMRMAFLTFVKMGNIQAAKNLRQELALEEEAILELACGNPKASLSAYSRIENPSLEIEKSIRVCQNLIGCNFSTP